MPIILFFLNPAVSIVYAFLSNIKKNKRIFYVFIMLFSLYFGYSLTPINTSLDSFQIIRIFNNWNYLFPSYLKFLSEWINFKNSFAKDLFEGTIFSFVHSFTDDYHYVFLLVALVFAMFKLKSFDIFLRDYRYSLSHIILTVLFFTSIPLFEINGLRFFTASWIAIFATLKFYVDREKKYVYLLASLPLVHITYFFYLFMFAIAYIATKWVNEKVILLFFATSVVFGLVWNTLPEIGDWGDGVGGTLLKSYVNDDYKNEIDVAIGGSNFVKFFGPLRYLYYNILALVLMLKGKKKSQDCFVLVVLSLLSIANFVGFIPSMSRFFMVLIPFVLIVLNKRITAMPELKKFVYVLPLVEMFRIYQYYFTLYPDVTPNGFLLNILFVMK